MSNKWIKGTMSNQFQNRTIWLKFMIVKIVHGGKDLKLKQHFYEILTKHQILNMKKAAKIHANHFFSGIFSHSFFADFSSFLSCLRLMMIMNPTIATMKQSIPIIENTITLWEPCFGDFFSSNFSFLSYFNESIQQL